MAIKRWIASKDTTITNAFFENLTTRARNSNMGASDVVEVFSIYAQASSASVELSRALMEFPIEQVTAARTAAEIPASGSVSYFIKLSNTPHSFTTPNTFYLTVQPVSRSWTEGSGLDMESYSDLGVASWYSASATTAWTTEGGDYHASPTYNSYFDTGVEDLELEITDLVEEWIAGTKSNNGIGIQLSSSLESAERSYYTKKLFGRGSEFFFKRPFLEARWDSSIKDDRENFYISSSLLPAEQNLNKLYLYNRFKGSLYNIPAAGTGSIYVSLYSSSAGSPTGSALTLYNGVSSVTGTYVSTGIYSASLAVNSTVTTVQDVWHNNAGTQYFTGSAFEIKPHSNLDDYKLDDYVINVTNMKPIYSNTEVARFRVFARPKDWQPTIYTVALNDIETTPIENAYYKILRVVDDYSVIPYGTGSSNHTLTSYDKEGNYFDLDMSMLETGYSYAIKFTFLQEGEYREQRESFKFRIE